MSIKFKNEKGLAAYTSKMKNNIHEGELVYCEDSNKTYTWHEKNWQEIKINTEDDLVSMSLYEMNAQILSQLPDHTSEQIAEDIELINQYDQQKKARYYMLLCKEYSYYTLFNYMNSWRGGLDSLGEAVIDCLNSVGTVRSCDYDNIDNPNAIEIWVCINDKEVQCFHLFAYDEGVVEFSRIK